MALLACMRSVRAVHGRKGLHEVEQRFPAAEMQGGRHGMSPCIHGQRIGDEAREGEQVPPAPGTFTAPHCAARRHASHTCAGVARLDGSELLRGGCGGG